MEGQKKACIFLTFFLALGAIILICVSLGTDHWVESEPEAKFAYNIDNSTAASKVNFGLFKGGGELNYGVSPRQKKYSVVCAASKGVCIMYSDDDQGTNYTNGLEYIDWALASNHTDVEYKLGLFKYGYWMMTIVSASLAITFGLISMGFAVFNVCGKPIETITGPMGLYLWNGIGFLFVVLEIVMFLVMFFTSLKKNFIIDFYDKFDSQDYTHPGYSFYLVPAAGALYLINLLLLLGSGYKLRCSFSSEAEKVVDNGMILY